MNSYGSVSRVSEAIYKLLRYMNWVSSDTTSTSTNTSTEADNHTTQSAHDVAFLN
jgi:hypothetical protein